MPTWGLGEAGIDVESARERGQSQVRLPHPGLAIAAGLAEPHGGRLQLQSAPGAGSIFGFMIPTAEDAARREEAP